jgi:N-acetylglucosaminyldiphosphoundecaprenol N-acetyl-beta-D-mannosaminyltransferase
MKEVILGYAVDTLTLNECTTSVIENLARPGECKWLACLNPHSYVVGIDDEVFSSALKDANWLIPDGVGVVYASKLLGGNVRQRVSGPDFFFSLNDEINRLGGVRVFFLGGADNTLSLILERMKRDYPGIQLAGSYSPPFKEKFSAEDIDEMIASVNAANTDILWVGLSAPKQEKWIYENRDRLNVKFIGAVGAVFDFYAETVRRSPLIFQKMGLEWLPRLLQQPRRLWRRMFVSAPIFIWHVLKTWVTNLLK